MGGEGEGLGLGHAWGMIFFLSSCARIFCKVKHRSWLVDSMCSIFPRGSPCMRFFSAVFAVQDFLGEVNAQPSPPTQ